MVPEYNLESQFETRLLKERMDVLRVHLDAMISDVENTMSYTQRMIETGGEQFMDMKATMDIVWSNLVDTREILNDADTTGYLPREVPTKIE